MPLGDFEVKFFDNGWMAKLRRKLNFGTAMEKVVRRVLIEARHNAPVKTGRLKKSITGHVENFGTKGVIRSDVSYARYVEYGTRYIAPRYYIKRAIDKEVNKGAIRADFEQDARRQLEG